MLLVFVVCCVVVCVAAGCLFVSVLSAGLLRVLCLLIDGVLLTSC